MLVFRQMKENQVFIKGIWRKIKESDIFFIGMVFQSVFLGVVSGVEFKFLIYQMVFFVFKIEDVWVRIEDCFINNFRFGWFFIGNIFLVIDSVLEKGSLSIKDLKDIYGKQSVGSGSFV